MRYCLGALALLVPLAFLPNWSFYYDITPKAVAMLFGVALLGLWSAVRPLMIETSPGRRWNGWIAAGFGLTVVLSALSSPAGTEAWIGSDWRRLGAVTLLAILGVAWLAAQGVTDRMIVLRGVCAAGVVAGAYGIAQYFGWDPFLDASGYHFGEGAYQIVRPPGPMGHSNYLAAFLLWPVFLGLGLWRAEQSWLGVASAVISGVAIALCGSRGAWAGLAAGTAVWMWHARPRWSQIAAGLAVVVMGAGIFYISPAGERMRARVFWMGEDSAGGSRLLLWRDSLGMAAARPMLGFGPDAFAGEFPRYQSAELSRAFPDFYHESPHNLFLDTLVNQGAPAMLMLAAWIGLAGMAAWRSREKMALPLLSGLAATVVAHQFAVWIVPTAFLLFLMLGLIIGLVPVTTRRVMPRWMGAIPAVAGVGFAIFGFQLAASDAKLAEIRNLLDAKQPSLAAEQWVGGNGMIRANLYFSQRWLREASAATTALDKLRFAQMAATAAVAASGHHEQQQNAWYNLAILQATTNDVAGVERSLRAASAAAPTWFKPHWTLARLLWTIGRRDEARAEARVALDLNGGRDREVTETLAEIVGSGSARR